MARASFFDVDECSKPDPLPHQFPDSLQFTAYMQGLGLNANQPVVVYDTGDSHMCCRLWFMLRVYGHTNVGVLNVRARVLVDCCLQAKAED